MDILRAGVDRCLHFHHRVYSIVRAAVFGSLILGVQLISLATVVDPRASIPLIAPAALAVILLIYEMVS